MKNIIIINLLVFILILISVASSECGFYGEIEAGPYLLHLKKIPQNKLPSKQNSYLLDWLSIWSSLNYSFSKFQISLQGGLFSADEVERDRDIGPRSINDIARLYQFSSVVSYEMLKVKRITFYGLGGYQYSKFRITSIEDVFTCHKNEDTGPLINLKTKISFNKNHFIDASYKYVYFNYPLQDLTLALFIDTEYIGYITKFRYINQKDIFNLYVFTLGIYRYF